MSNQQQQAKAPNLNVDPGAPFSQEAEEAVIGSILIEPAAYISVAAFLKPLDFFLVRHQYIWQAFERLNERGEPIDHITLAEELENMKVLDTIGGRAYIIQLANNTGTSMHSQVYGRLVERTSIRRKFLSTADEIKRLARDEKLNIDTVISQSQEKILAIQSSEAKNAPVLIGEVLSDYYDVFEYALQNPAEQVGTSTGYRDLDTMFNGFHRGDLWTVAGRPGTGKTSLLLCFGANVARFGGRVLLPSLEMPLDQLVTRLLAMETGVNAARLRNFKVTPQEAGRITEAIGRISNWPLWVWDVESLTVGELRSHAKRIRHEHGLDLILADYVQLMHEPRLIENRVLELSYITRRMKSLAKDLNCTVVQGAQLSRDVEKRADKRPHLADLRESGSIENDSDVVVFLYRDELYNEDTEFPNQADLIVGKHRNGPTGTVSLYFEKSLTKFMDASVHRVDLSGLE
jgi:replicative DNA helicase